MDAARIAPAVVASFLPVLDDLTASGVTPSAEPSDFAAPDFPAVRITTPGGDQTSIALAPDEPLAVRVAHVTDQLQDVVVEGRWTGTTTWPECPSHPDSHPLEARVLDAEAVWVCPRRPRTRVVAIGSLAALTAGGAVVGEPVRLMWDDGVVVPLWHDGCLVPEEPVWLRRELGLGDATIRALTAWGEAVARAELDPPAQPELRAVHRALDEEARALVVRMRGEIGDRFPVEYQSVFADDDA